MRHCDFCVDGSAVWRHSLDPERSRFRVYGKGHIWADSVELCDRCEQLYRAGEDEALIALRPRSWERTAEDVEQSLRNSMTAFRSADRGAQVIADWLPPGTGELVAQGFVPLEDLTGAMELGGLWPAEHARSLDETRPGYENLSPDGRFWLVRSPWPSISTEHAMGLLWNWVLPREHPPGQDLPPRADHGDRARRAELVREFLALDERQVLEFGRTLEI